MIDSMVYLVDGGAGLGGEHAEEPGCEYIPVQPSYSARSSRLGPALRTTLPLESDAGPPTDV